MAAYINMDHLRFLLHEVLHVSDMCAYERFSDYDREAFDILLESTKDYADKHMYPFLKEMDEQPAHYKDGKIIVHPQVGKFMRDCGENGAIGSTFSYDDGGMQLPHTMHSAVSSISIAANNALPGYTGLTMGAADLLVTYASQELKDKYVPNMLKGIWGGTMCLTEPQAGSSLTDITTTAYRQDDGSFKIKGQKIFISSGDYEYVDNIVHLLIGRIEGAPAGTKGISLFVVPKKRIKEDGNLESNDVTTAGDFQKMGQRGYCTTHLIFGEQDDCQAWLVGEENRGLKNMFLMMNGARIDVGLTAVSMASAAYHASLQYAKERPQGRRVVTGKKDANEPQTTIINHPDVRRMLHLQEAIVEGAYALLLTASNYQDKSHYGPEEDRQKYHELLELLTPIAKTYPSEKGQESINNGLQVLGGYGFCTDFPLEQYYRDIRITALYEGTTGIQSLDLLGRKVVMNNGSAMKHLTSEIISTIKEASTFDDLLPYAEQMKTASKELAGITQFLLQYAMKGEHERYIADATIYMDLMSNVVIAWQWLKMATVAKTALVSGNTTLGTAFYERKIHTMRFFFKYELPKIMSAKMTLMNEESLTIPEENKIAFS